MTSTGARVPVPDVSAVVVAWRAREDVLACLASLQEHAGLPYEAIVVDDGSDDGTPEAVRERFPEAKVLAKPFNEGLVAGRNAALGLVEGRIVAMLDADTQVRRGALPALVRVLDDHPEVGLVGPKLVYPDGELQLSSRRWPPLLLPLLRRGPLARVLDEPEAHRRHLMMDWGHDERRPVVWVAGAAQVWRADLPKRIGAYDRRVSSYGGEDMDWCMRVWRAGLEVHYVPDAEIVHVWQKMTNRNPFGRQSWRALRDYYYLQVKHRSLRTDPRLRRAAA
jgi:GT2 family glycosyltransferase